MQKTENIKVLFVIPTNIFGGGEIYIKNLLSYKNDNIDKFVISFNKELLFLLKDEIFYGKYLHYEKNIILNKLKMIFYINKLIFKFKINLVFLNGFSESGVYSRFILRKSISIAHSNEFWLVNKDIKSLLKRFLYLKIGCSLDKLIVINKIALNNVNQIKYLKNKSNLIYNGVNIIEVDNKTIDRKSINIGRISRLCSGKGNDILIKAFSKVSKNYSNIFLYIAGEGPEKNNLELLVNQLDISDKVFFMGFVEAKDFFDKIDCMYSTSDMETLPLVILEAFSCKRPVVATKVGGVPELIEHDYNGYLINPYSIEEIENSIIYFINNKSQFEKYAKNAYNIYRKKFTLEKMSIHTYELIKSVINEK